MDRLCDGCDAFAVGGVLAVPFVGGLVIYAVIRALVRAPGASLQQKFVKLGTLKGRPEADIVAAVGPPQSRGVAAGGYLLQWMATGYHIALRFDAQGICQGVTHEFKSR